MGKITIILEDTEDAVLDVNITVEDGADPEDNSYKVMEFLVEKLEQHSEHLEVVNPDNTNTKKKLLN